MKILGIETSCDDTGVALYDDQQGLLAHGIYSQTDIHAKYGGVVPELASRDHIRKLVPLINKILAEANCKKKEIDGIAYTAGPGLAGALFVGTAFGRTLGWAWKKPTIAVHHLEGHILAPMLEENRPTIPFIALLVSGGHTLLIHVKKIGEYEILGETQDDAAGEAFDKTAKLLGLGYPGGAALSKLAEQGDPKRYKFPRPMLNQNNLNFSYSGLKTHAINTIKQNQLTQQTKADIARAFVDAVVETLVKKCQRAIKQTGVKELVIAGGVSANQQLRTALTEMTKEQKAKLYYPRIEFCTDNGAMIAYAGYLRLKAGQTDDLRITIRPRWPLTDLNLAA